MNKVQVRLRGDKHFRWKGGTINGGGYLVYNLASDHPLFCMADKQGRVRHHRIVMAQHIGRPLEAWEVVHHKNGNKLDNDISNLELLSSRIDHLEVTAMQVYIKRLEEENKRLREELCRTS